VHCPGTPYQISARNHTNNVPASTMEEVKQAADDHQRLLAQICASSIDKHAGRSLMCSWIGLKRKDNTRRKDAIGLARARDATVKVQASRSFEAYRQVIDPLA
jgi:hypothetical protein